MGIEKGRRGLTLPSFLFCAVVNRVNFLGPFRWVQKGLWRGKNRCKYRLFAKLCRVVKSLKKSRFSAKRLYADTYKVTNIIASCTTKVNLCMIETAPDISYDT